MALENCFLILFLRHTITVEGILEQLDVEEVKLGDIQVKYNTDSQGTGSVNNIMDVYPWLQSYLGAYMIGGAGSFQMRVVRG